MSTDKSLFRLGYYSAWAFAILTLITWGLGMIAVPPAGPYCPGDCMTYPFSELLDYYPRDYYWMYLAIFQLFSYVIFIVVLHFITPAEKKIFGFLGVAFMLIAAVVLLIAYFVQFSVVPLSMMKGETEGIALITQYNGHGIFIALEELGYISMSISFLFMAFGFSAKTGLEKTVRLILFVPFLAIVLSFFYYTARFGLDRSYRFEVAAIAANWLISITAGILVSIVLRRRLRKLT